MSSLLNPTQRNSLTITVREFERQLRRADAVLQAPDEIGILYRRALRLSPEESASIRETIALALSEVAALVQELNLAPEDESPLATLSAQMSVSWANLTDVHAAKLARYGAVDPRLAGTLDPQIDRLAAFAMALANAGGETTLG